MPAALSRLLALERSGSVEINGRKVTVSAGIRPTGTGLTPVGWINLKVTQDHKTLEYKTRDKLRDARSLAMITAFLTDGAPEPLIDYTLEMDEPAPRVTGAPMQQKGPVLTVTLPRSGVVVYAKKTHGRTSAVAYGGRAMAESRVAALGAGWQVWQGRARGFYAAQSESVKNS